MTENYYVSGVKETGEGWKESDILADLILFTGVVWGCGVV